MSEPRRLDGNELPADVVVRGDAGQPGGYMPLDEGGYPVDIQLAPASRPVVDPTSGTLALDLYEALEALGLIRAPGS